MASLKGTVATLALVVAAAVGLACNGNDGDDGVDDAPPRDTLDCGDFPDRDAAQEAYERARETNDPDPHGLDEDGDGEACENDEATRG